MATKSKLRLPFPWLSRYQTFIALALVTALGAFFRFYKLFSLPPGLDETSARIGLEALKIGHSQFLPALDSTSGYAPLWVWLQALSISILGPTELALRIWPALLGTAAVIATWLWLRDWFGARPAWVGAIIMASLPWAVTASRNGVETALFPLLIPLTLWVATRALQSPTTWRLVALSLVIICNLLSGPFGWLLALLIVGYGVKQAIQAGSLPKVSATNAPALVIFGVGLGTFGYIVGTSLSSFAAMPKALHIVENLGVWGQNIVKVLLMMSMRGDENYRHNLAGEPLLNAFLGIMLVAGLLVSIARLHKKYYPFLLVLLVVFLVPATLTTTSVPNASWAIGALPIIIALASLGTSYMLELWFATFPINSAAKLTGKIAIALLLFLSVFQGYTQYFKAWAHTAAVHAAYNEGMVAIAKHVIAKPPSGETYIVGPKEQLPVVEYLAHRNAAAYRTLTASELESLPLSGSKKSFYVAASSRDETVKVLKGKFAGGVLRPQYSKFNQAELYYTYEVAK